MLLLVGGLIYTLISKLTNTGVSPSKAMVHTGKKMPNGEDTNLPGSLGFSHDQLWLLC